LSAEVLFAVWRSALSYVPGSTDVPRGGPCDLAKDSAVKARPQAINQLEAVLAIADPALREQLSSLGNASCLFRTCARLSPLDGIPL
jgi:hypothetical protein